MLALSIAYGALLVLLVLLESMRISKRGPDLLSLIGLFFVLQLVVPGMFLCGFLARRNGDWDLGGAFLEQVLREVRPETAGLVFSMTMMFLAALVIGYAAVDRVRRRSRSEFCRYERIDIESKGAYKRWLLVMILGVAGMYLLVRMLGRDLADGYINLIRFRAGDPGIERTALTANLYSATQAFLLISIFGFSFKVRHRLIRNLLSVLFSIVFVIASASRRAILIVPLLLIMSHVIGRGRWRFGRWVMIGVFGIVIIGIGKQVLSDISRQRDIGGVTESEGVLPKSIFLRTTCEVGISVIESWATVMYVDIPRRFGIDHVLSVARRFPEGAIGLDIPFPERIVRLTTERFVGPDEQDIPPGLIGQTWLDFGFCGALIEGLAFGIFIGWVEGILRRLDRDVAITRPIYAVTAFVVALPFNTGSLDFNFSIDIFILLALLLIIFPRSVSLWRRGSAKKTSHESMANSAKVSLHKFRMSYLPVSHCKTPEC